jgi:hypothetical protein
LTGRSENPAELTLEGKPKGISSEQEGKGMGQDSAISHGNEASASPDKRVSDDRLVAGEAPVLMQAR